MPSQVTEAEFKENGSEALSVLDMGSVQQFLTENELDFGRGEIPDRQQVDRLIGFSNMSPEFVVTALGVFRQTGDTQWLGDACEALPPLREQLLGRLRTAGKTQGPERYQRLVEVELAGDIIDPGSGVVLGQEWIEERPGPVFDAVCMLDLMDPDHLSKLGQNSADALRGVRMTVEKAAEYITDPANKRRAEDLHSKIDGLLYVLESEGSSDRQNI